MGLKARRCLDDATAKLPACCSPRAHRSVTAAPAAPRCSTGCPRANNVVGTVPVWGEQVLLCRRAIEPLYGLWTLPAGFLELGETTAEGALRETDEEAGARIELGALFTVLNVPRVGQVHLFYLARMLDTTLNPGSETIEARLFHEAEIPWGQIAFRTVRTTLQHYFDDRRSGRVGVVHLGDIG
jgi:ADP-ribose pyrophosphatase YjhB (NUDIX family)